MSSQGLDASSVSLIQSKHPNAGDLSQTVQSALITPHVKAKLSTAQSHGHNHSHSPSPAPLESSYHSPVVTKSPNDDRLTLSHLKKSPLLQSQLHNVRFDYTPSQTDRVRKMSSSDLDTSMMDDDHHDYKDILSQSMYQQKQIAGLLERNNATSLASSASLRSLPNDSVREPSLTSSLPGTFNSRMMSSQTPSKRNFNKYL